MAIITKKSKWVVSRRPVYGFCLRTINLRLVGVRARVRAHRGIVFGPFTVLSVYRDLSTRHFHWFKVVHGGRNFQGTPNLCKNITWEL